MAIWDPRKEKLHTLVLLGLEEVRRHPTSYFLSSFCWGNTWFWFWVLLVGSLTPLLRQLTSLPSHPQFWLCLVWQSVCVCQSVSVLSFSYLIVALCFIFGESGQGSFARHSALDLVLTCLRISRKKSGWIESKIWQTGTALGVLHSWPGAQHSHCVFVSDLVLNICLYCGLYVLAIDYWLRK